MTEEKDYSEDYPLSGMLESYDIWREEQLLMDDDINVGDLDHDDFVKIPLIN